MLYRSIRLLFLIIALISTESVSAFQLPIGPNLTAPRVDWNPNGTMLAVSTNSVVEILSAANGQVIRTLPSFPNFVTDVQWSPNGTRLAISNGYEVAIWREPWDTNILQPELVLEAPVDNSYYGVVSVDWHPFEAKLLGVSTPNLHIWNTTSGGLINTITPYQSGILYAKWSRDGSQIAIGDMVGGILIEDLINGNREYSEFYDREGVFSLDWNPAGNQIAAGNGSGIIQTFVFSPFFTGSGYIETLAQKIVAIAWNPVNVSLLATGTTDGKLTVWDISSLQKVEEIQHDGEISSVAWSPDGEKLTYGYSGGISTIDAPVNIPPIANAGVDQTVTDADNNGSEVVTLDGSDSSDSDGTITSYVWTEGSTQIASGVNPQVTLAVGTHTITLTVTDDDGATDTDEVVIIVNSPTTSGEILFTSERDGNWEVYTMQPDGSGVTRLTNNPAMDFYPTWFPNHDKILFASSRDGNIELYVMNPDGSGQTRLTSSSGDDYGGSVSPDGSKIVFVSSRDGDLEVFTMNVDGTNPQQRTFNTAFESIPSWSPDGSKIGFSSSRSGNYDLYQMNPDGSGVQRLTTSSNHEFGPAWSPDGAKLAYVSNEDGDYDIYASNVDGSDFAQLTANTASDGFAIMGVGSFYGLNWSQDSSQLVFLSNRDGNLELYRMNADGSGQTRLTTTAAGEAFPDW